MTLLAFLFVSCIPYIIANDWVELGQCSPWTYTNVDDWDLVTCSSPNVCETGDYQSPVKISSQHTVTDESLQALNFTGYGPGTVTLQYNGVDVWVDYPDQGTFSNPGEGEVFKTVSITFTTHNEQLLFTGVNRLSLDIKHYQIRKTWDTVPVSAEAVAIISMYFRIGNASTYLDPLFNSMKVFKYGKNIPKFTQNVTATWKGLSDVFEKLRTDNAHGYFNFDGSLTAPPCSETVEWFIFDYEWEISQEQFLILKNLVGGNQRPVQRQLAKVDFFDPLIGKPQPFSFSNLSNGSIAAIVLACLFIVAALLALIFGLTTKNTAESYSSY